MLCRYDIPFLNSNSNTVWDMAFHPYRDDVLATCGEDDVIHVDRLPLDFGSDSPSENLANIGGHSKTVTSVRWNPSVDGLLATSSLDGNVNLADIHKGSSVSSTGTGSDVSDVSWAADGGNVLAVNKAKKVLLIDPRQKSVALETIGHEGTKPAKCVWLGETGRAVTTGFTKMRERELLIWDARKLEKPLTRNSYGSSPSVLTPHYDNDAKLLFLAGRGEGTVYTLDMSSDKAPFFTDLVTGKHLDKEPHTAVALAPKRCLDVMGCEIDRMYRVLKESIQVLHFHVSRRNMDFFQDELYPHSASAYSLTAEQYLGGSTSKPVMTSLEPK